jgi:hypothetical protein
VRQSSTEEAHSAFTVLIDFKELGKTSR